jgi:hypothetical protein
MFRPLLLHLHQLSQNQTQSDLRINAELDRAVSPEWMVVSIMIGVIGVVVIVISTIMMISTSRFREYQSAGGTSWPMGCSFRHQEVGTHPVP